MSPGFDFSSGSGNRVGSRFALGGGEPPLYRNWTIAFVLPAPAVWET
ncbi:MAG: hypothetical protein H0V29_07605 [Thermoleophilaceae bacterium]|nr:hypothetical protein [Thermoleophilaceae bacterium]